MLKAIFLGLALYEGTIQVSETIERHHYWKLAREYCDKTGKQLLRIGIRRSPFEPPNGDVTLDIDPIVLEIKGGVLGDERRMPFADKQFGVCFNEHTLEHLVQPEDVELAVNECVRVADIAILLAPSPYSLVATFFCPTHNLRLWFEGNTIRVKRNEYITGAGFPQSLYPDPRNLGLSGIGQAIITKSVLKVYVLQENLVLSDGSHVL